MSETIFGRCDCGAVTSWAPGETPRWTCVRCLRVRALRDRSEQYDATVTSFLASVQAVLKRDRATDPIHDAEHALGLVGAASVVAHVRRYHLEEDASVKPDLTNSLD